MTEKRRKKRRFFYLSVIKFWPIAFRVSILFCIKSVEFSCYVLIWAINAKRNNDCVIMC